MDQHGAALLAMGILGAYVRQLKTGVGTRVEASLFNAGIDLQAEALTLYYSGERDSSVLKRDSHLATWFHAAPYGVYRLADAHIVLSLNALPTLARALDNDELSGFDGNAYERRNELAAQLAAILAPRRLAELAPALDAFGIWYERVQDYDDLKNDPQAVHAGMFSEFSVKGGTATLVNHPLRYDGGTPRVRHVALAVGQDTVDVLSEAGVSPEDIERLAQDGVIRVAAAEVCA